MEATMHSLLYNAAMNGDLPQLKQLTEKNSSILLRVSQPKLDTVLHVVAGCNHKDSARFICSRCPELMEKANSKGDSAFHIAARAGHFELLESLVTLATEYLKAGGRGDGRNIVLGVQNKDGNTVLHEAIRKRDVKMVGILMKADAHLANFVNKIGESPLYIAADRGLLPIVRKILEYESEGSLTSISHRGPRNQTALHVATARDHREIVIELVTRRKDLVKEKDGDGRTPLHFAASFGRSTLALHFLSTDSSCAYIKDKDGHSPIHLAASKGHSSIIHHLVTSCSDAKDLLNREEQNALHIAAKHGKEKVVEFLLSNPKFLLLINETDSKGNTALHLATEHWHPKIVSLLTRDERVDMGITNKTGLTALDIAERNIDTPASFRKLLTLAALRAANAPSGQHQLITVEDKKERISEDATKMGYYKDRVNTFVLVATLIATVTFAAGFTIPGGYHSDGSDAGTAILLAKPAFHVCLICNTIAMYLSIIIIVILLGTRTTDVNSLASVLKRCSPILGFALMFMAVAFAAGLWSVVSELTWFLGVVLAIAIAFILCISSLFFALNVLLWSMFPRWFFQSRRVVYFLMFFIGDE